MSTKKQKHKHPPTHVSPNDPPSFFSNTVLLGMTAVLGGLMGYAAWQYYHDGVDTRPIASVSAPPENTPAIPATSTPAAPSSTPAVAPGTPADPAKAQALRGKWVRNDSDGNYVLDIKNIADGGKLEAAYLNPKPIKVAKAEATTVDGQLQVFVELRDVNYPGSTYDLRYDATNDKLVGEYFQATQGQRFQVQFDR